MKLPRLIFELADEFGITIEHVEQNSHFKLTLVNRTGAHRKLIISVSPSDGRALHNIRADFRRFSKVIK